VAGESSRAQVRRAPRGSPFPDGHEHVRHDHISVDGLPDPVEGEVSRAGRCFAMTKGRPRPSRRTCPGSFRSGHIATAEPAARSFRFGGERHSALLEGERSVDLTDTARSDGCRSRPPSNGYPRRECDRPPIRSKQAHRVRAGPSNGRTAAPLRQSRARRAACIWGEGDRPLSRRSGSTRTSEMSRGCRNIGLSGGFKRLPGWLEISLVVSVGRCC